MSVNQTSKFERTEQFASLIAGVVGTVVSALFIWGVGGPKHFREVAAFVGSARVADGLALWGVGGMLCAVLFAVIMSRTINKFSHTIIMISRKSRVTQRILVPLLHESALGVTAGSMGLIWGQVLGFGLYAYVGPIVLLLYGMPIESYPLANFFIIIALMIYGQVLGAVYGNLLEARWFDPGRTSDEQNAAAIGAVVGGLVGGGVLQWLSGREAMVALASLAGGTSSFMGWVVYMLTAFVFGLLFAPVLARTINDFTGTVIMFSRRSKLTQKILVPLLTRSALAVTAGSMGLIYGSVLGVAFYAVALAGGPIPQLGLAGVVSFAVFGNVLGNVYGLVMENGLGFSDLSPSAEQSAGVRSSVIAGFLSGLFVLFFVPPERAVFHNVGSLIGQRGFFTGFALWMGLSVLFGLAFVTYVSRTINGFTSTVIMFSRRSRLTQKLLVPLLSRAALTVTAGSMGLGYGLLLGVVLYVLLMPIALAAVGVSATLPQFHPMVLLAFVIYGQTLGWGYGYILEEPELPSLGLFSTPDEDDDREDAGDAGDSADVSLSGFNAWRVRRPFSGGILLMFGGGIISAIPLYLQTIPFFRGASKVALGLVFGSMVVACGGFALAKPDLSTLAGMTGIAMSILSLIGAFGGIVVGTMVGIVGGSLCIAWQNPAAEEEEEGETRFRWIGESERQQW